MPLAVVRITKSFSCCEKDKMAERREIKEKYKDCRFCVVQQLVFGSADLARFGWAVFLLSYYCIGR